MAKYEKWLGAGLGWMVTGNPIGGLVGFFAGTFIAQNDKSATTSLLAGISEFETSLIVLASHLIKIDGKVSLLEITFVQQFLDAHFDEKISTKRTQVINHCMHREYSLTVVCDQLRAHTSIKTRTQIVRFLFDLASADGKLTERENYFIFRIAGYLTINDVAFKKIKLEQYDVKVTAYTLLGVYQHTPFEEIRNSYRRQILKYHPDRNVSLSDEEKRKLTLKFQQIKEAYEFIKKEKKG